MTIHRDLVIELRVAKERVAELEAELDDALFQVTTRDSWKALLKESEAEAARLREAGDALAKVAAQYFDTGRGDLDGMVDRWRTLAGGGQDYTTTVLHESSNAPEALAGGGQDVQAVGERGEQTGATWESATE